MRTKSALLKIAIVALGITACASTAPHRSFTTADLLIDSAAMPIGWEVAESGPISADSTTFTTNDSAGISFYWNGESPDTDKLVKQIVVRYPSSQSAKSIYDDLIVNHAGSAPIDWIFASQIAGDSHITCYDSESGLDYQVCEWAGRYKEYAVLLIAWQIPDHFSLQDMEKAVKVIDAKMAQRLELTP